LRNSEHGGIFFRLLSTIVFLALLFFLYAIRHPLMRFAGEFWLINDPVTKSDAMLVLGDDNYQGDRAFHAAALYRQEMAPLVVASGRTLRNYAGMADIIGRDLETYGVPASAILKAGYRGADTRGQAEGLAELAAHRGWKRVLVITSDYDARRARFIFEHVFPASIQVAVSGGHDTDFDAARWWETGLGIRLFFGEVLGYLEAQWELRGRAAAR
jgi:uncharacterized SAM-binding protein YcdF (DUF218 family)